MENTNFTGSLGQYQTIPTKDGSFTLFSEAFAENCHSLAGAKSETHYNYVLGCQLERAKNLEYLDTFTVFEVGFATGLGFLTSWEYWKEELKSPCFLSFVTCEIDEELALFTCHFLNKDYGITFEKKFLGEVPYLIGKFIGGELIVLLGDIRQTFTPYFKNQNLKPMAIYQDPFSPKKNPLLWTTEWFLELHQESDPKAIMGTYCATKAIWKSMIEAGWIVSRVPGHGDKKLSTRAFKAGKIEPELLETLQRSPRGAFRDHEFLN